MKRLAFGLHPTVLLLAGTHFIVDAFNNVYAPLLPLLIPRLSLSLAAAGTLQMCFQLANSVAQLGFGQIADRWRPRALLIAGPIVTVSILTLVGLAPNVWILGLILVAGGFGSAAFHPRRRRWSTGWGASEKGSPCRSISPVDPSASRWGRWSSRPWRSGTACIGRRC